MTNASNRDLRSQPKSFAPSRFTVATQQQLQPALLQIINDYLLALHAADSVPFALHTAMTKCD
jgi:hypothetical protein